MIQELLDFTAGHATPACQAQVQAVLTRTITKGLPTPLVLPAAHGAMNLYWRLGLRRVRVFVAPEGVIRLCVTQDGTELGGELEDATLDSVSVALEGQTC